jgi:hypothetical protein
MKRILVGIMAYIEQQADHLKHSAIAYKGTNMASGTLKQQIQQRLSWALFRVGASPSKLFNNYSELQLDIEAEYTNGKQDTHIRSLLKKLYQHDLLIESYRLEQQSMLREILSLIQGYKNEPKYNASKTKAVK